MKLARLTRAARTSMWLRATWICMSWVCAAWAAPAVAQSPGLPQPLWRINCGGPALAAPYGPPFLADQPYNATTHGGYVGGAANTWNPGDDLGGLVDPYRGLHATARLAWHAYRFDVPDGELLLRLHFAEVDKQVQGPGLRHFGVSVQGQPVLVDFDPSAMFGVRYGAELVVPVHVSDGRLNVAVLPGSTPAILNAIEVWTLPSALAPPAAVTGLSAKDGFGRSIVSWDPTLDPAVLGFRVWRGPSADGPFTLLATTWASPPRWLDAQASPGVPGFYRVEAFGPADTGPGATAGPATSLGPSASELPVYALALSPQDLQALDVMVLVDQEFEVPAVFTHDGASRQVTVRYRGGGSLLASKKSWKVNFPDDDLFEGRSKLNLKATFLDESLSVEPLCHGLFEDVQHPVSRQRHVRLMVNGVDRGVFNDIEQVDERYLAARDRDPGGSIYKGVKGQASFGLQPTLAGYQKFYEKKTNEQQPYDDLIALIELVNAPGTTALQLADVFDLNGYLDYLSVIGFTGDADQSGRNFYLLHDLALGRWEWITWDNDRSLFDPTFAIDGATSTCEECGGVNRLKDLVLGDPGLRWRYAEKLRELMDGAASPAQLNASIAALHAKLSAGAHADVAKLGWERDTLFDAAPAKLSAFAPARANFILGELSTYQPRNPPTAIWINELLTDNAGVLADEAGEFEDWVELYNAGSMSRDVGGLFLSDELSQPMRWRIPDGTVIPARGRLLIWCDDEEADGPLHAGFTLASAGGELGLVASDGVTLLDFVHWRPQLPDVSLGRSHDGGANFRLLPTPTPQLPNTAAGTLPPLVSWVEHAPALPTASQAVSVTALVLDEQLPLSVELFWRSGSGGPFTSLPMTSLPSQRWEAQLPALPAGTLVQFWLLAQDAVGGTSHEPSAAPQDVFSYTVQGASVSSLIVTEFMADNTSTVSDETGAFEDWVEIGNTSALPAELSGLFLTDDLAQPTKWQFPAGTQLGPFGRLLVWADEDPQDGPLHAAFKLSKSGESVALFDSFAHDNALLDAVNFGPQLADVSTGRLPAGPTLGGNSFTLVSLLDPSPSTDNVPPPGTSRRYDALSPAATSSALSVTGAVKLGKSMSLHLEQAPPNAQGLLLLGLDVLQLPLGADGVLLLYPQLSIAVPFVTQPDGRVDLALPLPGNQALSGLLIELQAYVAGGGLSNAVAARLGS